jgi:hypothetical protein
MKRLGIISGFLALGVILTVLSFVFRSDRTSRENMVRIREQTETQPPAINFNRGRIGEQPHMPAGLHTWTGLMVDAGCATRDTVALSNAPSGRLAVAPGGAQNSHGAAPNTENADAIAQQTPDLRARNADPSCAVTAVTRGYAVFLPDGELKNFDEGGNTKAAVAFEGTAAGQAVMNGRSLGDKPRVSVTGAQSGDRIVVQDIRIL